MSAWLPDPACETHEWRSSLGETIRFVTMVGAQQRFMPPVTITTLRPPGAQGGRFRNARHNERLVTLPVVMPGPQAGRTELRRWARALDPLKGEGTLTVVQGAYPGRQITCVYEAGLESWGEQGPLLGTGTLAFRAAEPYWTDAADSGLDSSFTGHRWFPFLPLILGAEDLFAEPTIVNTGDVDAWPVVTATGPGWDLTLTNNTTGYTWKVYGELTAANTLVVDTRPGHKAVRLDGVNAFGKLSTDSVLWPLVAGTNAVSINFGSADFESRVSFAWRNRWLAA